MTCGSMGKARCQRKEVASAIVNLDIDRFWHVAADVLALAIVRVRCHLRVLVHIVRLEAHDSAPDILNSKRLLKCSAKPHAHA